MSTTHSGRPCSPPISTVSPDDTEISSVYDGDLNSEAESIESTNNVQKHYMSRRKDTVPTSASSRSSADKGFQRELRPEVHHQTASDSVDTPRRCGKADWRPDLSSALFSASGQQYGLGDHQRGYLFGTFVTHLSYPEHIAHPSC